MNTKTIKKELFSCQLPSHFKPNVIGAYTTPFSFDPLPTSFRQEFWFSLAAKATIMDASTTDFTTAFAAFVQEGKTAQYVAENTKINGYDALKITYPETRQIPTANGPKNYQLTTQAFALFLDETYCFVILFVFDDTEETEALQHLDICLNSLQLTDDKEQWTNQIEQEAAQEKAYWAKQRQKKQLTEKNQGRIKHAVLGELKHAPNPNFEPEEDTFWEAELKVDGHQFRLNLNLGITAAQEQKVLALASQIITNFSHHFGLAEQAISNNFLTTYNEDWRQTGDPVLTETEFKNRISLTTIEVLEDLECNFWFDDDDLFGRHSLFVSVDIDQNNNWSNSSAEMFG